MANDLLSTWEAAKYLRTARQTLSRWRVEGFGPPWVRWSRGVFYRKDQLDLFIESHTRRSTSDTEPTEAPPAADSMRRAQ